jgi:hypothetical protein
MWRGTPCVWFAVQPSQPYTHRLVHIIPSGQEFDADNLLYIGTVQLVDAGLVFHIYVENE